MVVPASERPSWSGKPSGVDPRKRSWASLWPAGDSRIDYRRPVDNLVGVRLGYGDAVLTFHPVEHPSRGHTIATLDVYTLHVSLAVDLDTYEGGRLSDFFDSLAASWRGWDGAREWYNIERDFRLRCYHDGLGRVVVLVTMGTPISDGWPAPSWSTTAAIVVDPGALEGFAKELRPALDGR